MRLTKSLLCGIAALTLGTATAYADLMSEAMNEGERLEHQQELFALEESDAYIVEYEVITITPVEITETWVFVPSADSEMPRG